MISRDVRQGRSYQMLSKLSLHNFDVIGEIRFEIHQKFNSIMKVAESGTLTTLWLANFKAFAAAQRILLRVECREATLVHSDLDSPDDWESVDV